MFFNQQLFRNFSFFALLMILAALVGAIPVSLIAFRAARRLPSFALAIAIVAMSVGVPILTRTVSLNPQFNVLWFRLNEGRLAHLDHIARTDLAQQLDAGRNVPLPDPLADLAVFGTFSKIGDCAGGPVVYLKLFYPLYGDWSVGFVSLPCTDAEVVEIERFLGGLQLWQNVGGAWWFARY